MGSNMQRQAVPLLQSEAPLVGTGMESTVARDSGVAIGARRAGVVDQVDSTRIVIRVTEETSHGEQAVDISNLLKFQRSNQNTCINQRPTEKSGAEVEAGEILPAGPSTNPGQLPPRRHVHVALIPCPGH